MKALSILPGLLAMMILFRLPLSAQVGINTDGSQPDPSAGLDVKFINKGMLPPRMTTLQRDAISSPATGLIIYNLDCNDVQFFNGSAWVPLGNSGVVDPPGAITGKSSPCIYASCEVYSVAAVPGATGYTWMVPPGATITHGQGTDSITVNFGSTNGNICVSTVSSCAKSTLSCLNIKLVPGSALEVSISSNVNPACSEASHTFTAGISGIVVNPLYQWNVNGTDVPGETNSTYACQPVLNDRIECNVTSFESCIAGFTATGFQVFKGCQPVCYGEPIRLSCPFPSGGCGSAGSSYHWENSSGSWISSDQDPVIPFGEPGYATDLFYLTMNYSPPAGAVSKAIFFTEILSPIIVGGDTTPVSCFGQGNGAITLTVSGGSAPYSFLWNDAAATQNRTGIGPGIYSVTVTDALFCLNHDSLTNTFIISEPVNSLSVTGTITAVSCYGACDGGVDISDSGGTPPYTYAWSNSTTEQNASGLCAGTYTVTVTDARLCQVTASWTLENPTFAAPAPGVQVPGEHQVVWKWYPAATATGYKFNSTNDYGSATDLGTDTTHTETGLPCNTDFTRYVWAYNACEVSPPATLTISTVNCWTCGDSITVNHTAGAVAPVSKTVTYGTVTNLPGEPSKCWITSNLGADHQATAMDDATEESAGWYWEFNHKQGFKPDGGTVSPLSAWITLFYENSDWIITNDPCSIELGAGWRIPTFTEYSNIDNAGGWNDWIGPWNSTLKIHAAGHVPSRTVNPPVSGRGISGNYWSSTGGSDWNAGDFAISSSYSQTTYYNFKAGGFPLRCLRNGE
ncbi:MAG: hypothetical protein NTW16_16185 [Bacteroidetes bacterium]|nr:hypothetical protein [Bacteroidota bacterium]